jgi:linoleoyl-CoA desaturase
MGNHAAMSQYATRNQLVGQLMDFIGSSSLVWSMEHQVAHHCEPNLLGKDNDCAIGDPWLRFHEGLQRKWWHKYQHILTPIAMAGGMFRWYVGDFLCFRDQRVGSATFYPTTLDWQKLIFWKAVWAIRMVIIPLVLHGWAFLGPFFIHMLVTGYYLENIFIVNHIQSGLLPVKGQHWAVNNCYATSNWGTGSHFWNWVSAGLNHQVEHHLFPSLSHYLYPCVSQIVIQTCREYNIPFYNYQSFGHAWYAMIKHLEALGYDDADPLRPYVKSPINLALSNEKGINSAKEA